MLLETAKVLIKALTVRTIIIIIVVILLITNSELENSYHERLVAALCTTEA